MTEPNPPAEEQAGPPAGQLTREELSSMTPKEIMAAKREGCLSWLLSGQQ